MAQLKSLALLHAPARPARSVGVERPPVPVDPMLIHEAVFAGAIRPRERRFHGRFAAVAKSPGQSPAMEPASPPTPPAGMDALLRVRPSGGLVGYPGGRDEPLSAMTEAREN